MSTAADKLTVRLEVISPEIHQICMDVDKLKQWVEGTPLNAIRWMVDWCISTGKEDEVLEVAEWLQQQI